MGVARSLADDGGLVDAALTQACRDLWVLMAELATLPEHQGRLVDGQTRVSAAMLAGLERMVDDVGALFEPPSQFVVPGQTPLAAQLDLARTVARRAEREAVAVAGRGLLCRALPQPALVAAVGAGPLGRGRAPAGRDVDRPRAEQVDSSSQFPGPDAGLQAPSLRGHVDRHPARRLRPGRCRGPRGGRLRRPPRRRGGARPPRRRVPEAQGFAGKPGETLVVPGPSAAGGGGPRAGRRATTSRCGSSARRPPRWPGPPAASSGWRPTLLAELPTGDGDFGDGAPQASRADVARVLAEGTILGAYRYTALKSDPEASNVVRVDVVDGGEGDGDGLATAAFERGVAIAEAVCLARDLVNEPGGELTPTAFADRAAELAAAAAASPSRCSTGPPSRARRWAACWASTAAPTRSPGSSKLAYEPAEARGTVALVGKGITFDSGGLSLKTTEGMVGMKCDMAGAAAVLATFSALDALRPPVRVLGLPAADRQHARRRRHPGGRRAPHPQRHDRRGPQHRRRGPAGAGRRPGHGQRGPARRHRRPGHPHRRLHGGAGHPHRRADGQRRRLRRPGAGRGRRRRRGGVAPAPARRPAQGPRLRGGRPEEHRRRPLRRGAGRRACSSRSSWPAAPRGPTSTSPAPPTPPTRTRETRKGGTGFGVRTLLRLLADFQPPARN